MQDTYLQVDQLLNSIKDTLLSTEIVRSYHQLSVISDTLVLLLLLSILVFIGLLDNTMLPNMDAEVLLL